MALSIKAALPEPAPEEVAPDEKGESERPDLSTQPTRPKRPLKGGVDRPSGGEKFGLKW
jgi:small subunit ribosomal protein S1